MCMGKEMELFQSIADSLLGLTPVFLYLIPFLNCVNPEQ